MTRPLVRIVALLAAVLLVVGACGDSGGDDESTSTTRTSTDDGEGRTVDTDTDDGNDDGGIFGGSTIDLFGFSGECEALVEVILGFGTIVGGGTDGAALFASAADALPSDLRDDVAVIAQAAEDYSKALADLGIDLTDPNAFAEMTPEDSQRYAEAFETLNTTEIDNAFANLEDYGEAECSNFGGFGN